MVDEEGLTYDVICLGAGVGGLSAAITADEYNLRTLVLEKSPKIGGVVGISGGQCWAPLNHLAQSAGVTDSVDDAVAYMAWAGGNRADDAKAHHYCSRIADVVRFLEEKAGVPWRLVPVPDPFAGAEGADHAVDFGRVLEVELFSGESLGPARTITRTGKNVATHVEQYSDAPPAGEEISARRRRDDRAYGGALAGALVRNVLEREIEIWTEAEVSSLLVEEGRVAGVRVRRQGEEHSLTARRGVLLATGGYDSNAMLWRTFEGRDVSTLSLPSVTGDHLRLAGVLGAKVVSTNRPPFSFLEPDVAITRDEEGIAQKNDALVRIAFPHAIVVNRHGRRFCDETTGQSRDVALVAYDPREPWRRANDPCWAVWDRQHVDRFFGGKISDPEGLVAADSLSELAAAAGISPVGLLGEIERFNANVALGVDPDFGRGSLRASHFAGNLQGPGHPNLGTLERPPFYAVPLVVRTAGIGSAGLSTDEYSRVLDWNECPIPGLYAAGNAVALVELGIGYTSGNGNARGLLHGFCAAEHAASGS